MSGRGRKRARPTEEGAGAGAGAGAAGGGAGGGGGGLDAREEEEEEGEGEAHPAPPLHTPHSPPRPVYFLGRPATLLDVLDVTAAERYLREISRSCVGLCRESACLPGSSYQPMLFTLLAKEEVGLGEGWDRKGSTRLHHAARTGNVTRVRSLVQAGAVVDARDGGWQLTPLMYACLEGKEAAALALLDLGASHALRSSTGYTALWWAAYGGHTSVIRLLAGRGADVDAVDNTGWSPLMAACRQGKEAAARALLDLGAADGLAVSEEKRGRALQAAEWARGRSLVALSAAILAKIPPP